MVGRTPHERRPAEGLGALRKRMVAPPPAARGAGRETANPGQVGALLEVMRLLRGVRHAQGLSEAVIAARLGTTPNVVSALENGDLAALPEWHETRRILDQWVAGAGLDPRPALSGFALALEEHAALRLAHAEPFASSPVARSSKQESGGASSLRRWFGVASTLRRALAFTHPALRISLGMPPARVTRWVAIGLIAAAIGTTATQTKVVAGALSKLPAPAERAVRSISDFFSVRFAPVREGHRWIDVEDPRSRRGDKLRIGRHSD